MDARARLQRYLEQRREVGESELVLDGMSVEEVLALVGAKPPLGGTGKTSRPHAPVIEALHTPSDTPAPARESSGAENRADDPAGNAPTAPETRFDASAQTDWREALRDTRPTPTNDSKTTEASNRARVPGSGPAAGPPRDVVLPAWLEAIGWAGGIDVRTNARQPDADSVAHAIMQLPDLEAVAQHIRACTRCALHTGARNAVPGDGNVQAELVCVGEGPGASEDEQGLPFVGESGQLLTKILGAIQLSREAVYICNVVKHRPPGNRDPLPDEVRVCAPYLQQQLSLVKPRVILALGRFAAQTLLDTTMPLGKLRERVHMYNGVPVIATYHPAALLRNEAWKRPAWEDVKVARRILDLSRTADGGTTSG